MNKLIAEYNNTYHCSIGKNPVHADYSALTREIDTNPKAPKFRVCERGRITKYRNIFSKGYIENWSMKTHLLLILC